MARSYCTTDDVKKYLPSNIITEGANPTPNPRNPAPETLPTVNIDFYIQQACMEIDSALGTQYDVPLKKVNQGGEVGYPMPIPAIAALLASEMIYQQRLQGADRQFSEAVKNQITWAHAELAMIQNGERRLFGQRNTRGNRFIRGTLPNVPTNPAQGGQSKGDKG